MELKIINKKEDPLLSRTIVESEMAFESATPSRAEIKSKLAKDLGKDEKLVVVKGIYNQYGSKKAKNIAYIYENEESLKRIEVEKKKDDKKKSPAEAKEKPEGEQKQAKKEEAKQEEKPKADAKQEGDKPKEQKEIKEKGK